MNIAMFTNNYKPFIGGVPISIERLADGLRELGHKVYIFAPEYENQEDEEDIIRCKTYKRKQKSYLVPKIWDKHIENKFVELNIDMIHIHHPLLLGELGVHLGKKYDIPTVLTYHTRYEEYLHNISLYHRIKQHAKQNPDGDIAKVEGKLLSFTKHKFTPAYIKWFSNRCSGIIAPTQLIREHLAHQGVKSPIYVLPTGLSNSNVTFNDQLVEEIRQQYKGDKKYLLCSVSRLSEEKNLFFLIEGLKTLKEEIGDCFKMLLIGEGPQKEALREQVDKLGLKDNIELLGNIANEQISNYYKACDLFVFASLSETQGIVLIEAMSAGLPVVAIKATGVVDCISNGLNGYMTKHDIAEWSSRIKYILEDEVVKQRLANGAYQTSIKYLNTSIAERAVLYYKQMIANQNKKEVGYVPKGWKLKYFS